MDVLLNEEEELLKRSVREFLASECPTSLVRVMETDALGYPPELWAAVARQGWLGLVLPEAYGGDAAPLTHLGLILSEVGRAAAPLPLHSTMVAALTIAEAGSEAQRQAILPRVVNGELILTWSVIEADPRLAAANVHCEATPRGDGFRINGTKLFVDNFNVAGACLVACRTAPVSADTAGISLFLIDTAAAGITETLLPNMAGDKQSKVVFTDVQVGTDSLVGELNQGWPIVEQMTDHGTALLSAQITGATRKAVDMAIDYAKDRVAFGRPIGAFQAIAHICADIVTWVDGAELLTFEALWRLGQGLPASLEVATAKAFCNVRCQMCLHQANQIHGGLSQIRDFDLSLWYRRASAWTMREGTTFDHHRTIAAAILA
ncbi:MAG: acyl-CoA dehydrogenase family protein [Dehalococcoidia bacterium]